MSDALKNDETKAEEKPAETPEVKDEAKTEEPDPTDKPTEEPEEGAEGEPKTFDEAYVRELRTQSAGYRTRLKEVEEKLATMKSTEEVDELVNTLKSERETVERNLLVENVALKFKLPEALAKRLTGDTREALEADAKELATLVGVQPGEDDDTRLEGGLSPRDRDADPTDPRELAKAYGRRGRRR